MKSLLRIFANRNYTLLFFANFTSQMGSIIGITAFLYYILNRFTHNPSYASLTELMYTLPMLAVFWLIGVLADRFDRKNIASNCEFISALLSIALLFAVVSGKIILVFAFLFLRSGVTKFFQPAQQSLIQGILNQEEYTLAAGLNQMVSSIFMLVGGAIGIFAYWYLGVVSAIAIDSLSFIASGIMIRCCTIQKEVRLPNGSTNWSDMRVKTVFIDLKKGFFYILRNRLLLSIVIGFFMLGIVNGGLGVMPAFIMKYKLAPQTYEAIMIWVGVVFGTGVLLGSIVASAMASKFKLHQFIIAGLLISGTFLGLSGLATHVYLYLILSFIAAFTLPFVNIGVGGWMPRIVDPKMMGRVQGCISPTMMLSQSLTLGIIASTFPRYINITYLFITVGSVLVLVGFYYGWVLPQFSGKRSNNQEAEGIVGAIVESNP